MWIVKDELNQNRTSLTHYGIKGMKWGVRRTPEQLGDRQSKETVESTRKQKLSKGERERFKGLKDEFTKLSTEYEWRMKKAQELNKKLNKLSEELDSLDDSDPKNYRDIGRIGTEWNDVYRKLSRYRQEAYSFSKNLGSFVDRNKEIFERAGFTEALNSTDRYHDDQ